MKIKLRLVLLSFALIVVSTLSACSDLSHNVNHASDSIHRSINS